jgi:CBS domain-containing protein
VISEEEPPPDIELTGKEVVMNNVPPHVRKTITRLVRQSAGQSVSIKAVLGDLRKQFPHLPVTENELIGIITREASSVGRGVEFNYAEGA